MEAWFELRQRSAAQQPPQQPPPQLPRQRQEEEEESEYEEGGGQRCRDSDEVPVPPCTAVPEPSTSSGRRISSSTGATPAAPVLDTAPAECGLLEGAGSVYAAPAAGRRRSPSPSANSVTRGDHADDVVVEDHDDDADDDDCVGDGDFFGEVRGATDADADGACSADDGGAQNGGRARKSATSKCPSSAKGKGKGKKGKNLNQISRALSRILRHRAEEMGVHVRPDGFCPLRVILDLETLRELKATKNDIMAVVRNNDKKRFELEIIDGESMIRAVQGHSMKAVQDEELLQRLELGDSSCPSSVVHGTYHRYLDSILEKGLVAGGSGFGEGRFDIIKAQRALGRNHIHFVPYDKWISHRSARHVISGMRQDCDVAIVVDLPTAMKAGIPFYKSKNEVILSPGVNGVLDSRFFKEATCTRTGALYWSPDLGVSK